jgi:hypothetical protein
MKYIKFFEDFKVKNISVEDILNCIEKGGVVFATIINNFPGNDPDEPLNPLSVDEDGTITVEFNGNNYEVELKNIDRIEWI